MENFSGGGRDGERLGEFEFEKTVKKIAKDKSDREI
jgi:hypothetical protein